MKCLKVKFDGQTEVIDLPTPINESIVNQIGGVKFIKPLEYGGMCIAYDNEAGTKGLPLNLVATCIQGRTKTRLFGDVIFMGEIQGSDGRIFVDLPKEDIKTMNIHIKELVEEFIKFTEIK